MTEQSLADLRVASLHLRQGDARQEMAIELRRNGNFTATYDPGRASLEAAVALARIRLSSEGITLSEVNLEGHEPDLTALHRAASKLLLNVEITSGPLITEPIVKIRGEDPTQGVYFVPEGWDLTDALACLPDAFTAARPKVALALARIKEANASTGGQISRALDFVGLLILETGDPDSVYANVLRLLHQVGAETTTAQAPAKTA